MGKNFFYAISMVLFCCAFSESQATIDCISEFYYTSAWLKIKYPDNYPPYYGYSETRGTLIPEDTLITDLSFQNTPQSTDLTWDGFPDITASAIAEKFHVYASGQAYGPVFDLPSANSIPHAVGIWEFRIDSSQVTLKIDHKTGVYMTWYPMAIFEDVTDGTVLVSERWYDTNYPLESICDVFTLDNINSEHVYRLILHAYADANNDGPFECDLKASLVPEPCSFVLLGLGGLLVSMRKFHTD